MKKIRILSYLETKIYLFTIYLFGKIIQILKKNVINYLLLK